MILLLLTFCVIFICVLRWQRRKKIQCCGQFKNDLLSLPLIGHAPLLLGNGEDKRKFFQAVGREALKQGGMTHLSSWIIDKFFTVIAEPVVAELVLKNCLEKDDSMKVFGEFFRKSIAVVPVSEWRPRRKFLNPAFAMKYLNQHFVTFVQKSSTLIDKLKDNCGEEPFSIYNHISANSFDIVCESTFGVESNAQHSALNNPLLIALKESSRLISERMSQPLLQNQSIFELTPMYTQLKQISDTFWNFIDKNTTLMYEEFRRSQDNEINDTKPIRKSILRLLVEASDGELSKDIREETMTIIFAGSDTTSVTLSFTCLLLAKHPDVQEKVYQELQEVLGDSKRSIDLENLPQLRYTEAVLKETLRVYPPGLLLLRKIDKDLVLPSGQTLVKGTSAMINVWAIHRNPEYWGEDAEQFRPERWFDAPPNHPAAFIPFSCGPRNCIGYQFAMMSMKTTLATLIHRYRFTPATDQNIQIIQKEEIRTKFDILIRDVDDFCVKLQARA